MNVCCFLVVENWTLIVLILDHILQVPPTSFVASTVGVSILLLSFILIADGLNCFLTTGAGAFALVTKEKEKSSA